MKKIIISILMFFLVFSGIFADVSESDKKEAKIQNWKLPKEVMKDKTSDGLGATISLGNIYLFGGFEGEKYKKDSTSLLDIIEAEYNILKHATDKVEDVDYINKYGNLYTVSPISDDGFTIVGHSQGGLRVLAFAKYLKDHDSELFSKLKCVITVSGITKGIKALEGGFAPTKRQLYDYAGIITNGLYGVFSISNTIPKGFYDIGLGTMFSETLKLAGNKILVLVLKHQMPYIGYILDGMSENEFPEIRDMIPQSEFIKNNVVVTYGKYNYKAEVGTKKCLDWKEVPNRWGGTYWALRWKTVPIHAIKTTCFHKTKFPKEIPVGYIVGTKVDTASLAGEEKGKKIDAGAKIFGGVMATFAGLHIAKSIWGFGLFTGSPRYSAYCIKASKLGFKYQNYVNKLLKSNKNDGFVAEESQFIPKEERDMRIKNSPFKDVHKKTIQMDKQPKYHSEFPYSHVEIIYKFEIKKHVFDMIKKVTIEP